MAPPDADNDAFNDLQDCNDGDAGINPAKPELLNNDVGENCDGVKGFDRDGDGVQPPRDCDDNSAGVRPGIADVVDADVDENCDGSERLQPAAEQQQQQQQQHQHRRSRRRRCRALLIAMPFASASRKEVHDLTVLQVKAIPIGSSLKGGVQGPEG